MERSITHFSPETCNQINYYVYRLVDPRNGQTFYVGKGKNNRIFAHVECALDRYSDVDYNPEEDDSDNLKYQTIRKIKDAGLEVIYIIQRYGLSEHDAFVIESALIDAYSVDKKQLTNKIKGFDFQEPTNAITLEKEFAAPEYVDSPDYPPYVIIKVKDYWLNQRTDRYDCTRSAWRAKLNKVRKYPYVLSVTGGIVKEVYKVHEWHYQEGSSGRVEFTGDIAEESIQKIFKEKKIPEKYRKQGQASPLLYCKPI